MDGALFQAVADRIDAEWEKLEWREDAFAEIAERVVKAHEGELRSKLGDVKEIVRTLQTMPWPEQLSDNDYGFPSVAFGRTARTRVELVFWVDDAVKVHGHRAPGLFYVLHGERLHATYSFDAREDARNGLTLGDLHLRYIEHLKPGEHRRIGPDDHSIHALVTLGRPCVTLSIRVAHGIPYRFDSSHLLVDCVDPRRNMERLMQAFSLYLTVHEPESYEAMAIELLARPDVDILFAENLLRALRTTFTTEAYERVYASARTRFGDWLDKLVASYRTWLEAYSIEPLLKSPDLERGPRLLLGLIFLNADRASTRTLLEQMFPGEDPMQLIDAWSAMLRPPLSPHDQASITLGFAVEDELRGLLRRFRERVK